MYQKNNVKIVTWKLQITACSLYIGIPECYIPSMYQVSSMQYTEVGTKPVQTFLPETYRIRKNKL